MAGSIQAVVIFAFVQYFYVYSSAYRVPYLLPALGIERRTDKTSLKTAALGLIDLVSTGDRDTTLPMTLP